MKIVLGWELICTYWTVKTGDEKEYHHVKMFTEISPEISLSTFLQTVAMQQALVKIDSVYANKIEYVK